MSRLFEALSGLKAQHASTAVMIPLAVASPAAVPIPAKPEAKTDHHPLKVVPPADIQPAVVLPEPAQAVEGLNDAGRKQAATLEAPALLVRASPEARLVALSDPNSLGAEKFRALVTRFDHLRNQRELRSFQVTSSVIDEGKTLVAGNVAITLAKYSGAKTLLVEGDLHRPTLAKLFGLSELRGLNAWWSDGSLDLGPFLYRLSGMPLWFLPAGKFSDQPSDLLRSERFVKAFAKLVRHFEWVVVDSTPMLPIVDVNLWSKLLDGTLLVVREGVAPTKALKRGLQALNQPKLIGVVVNEATEFDQGGYAVQYYGGSEVGDKSTKNK